MYILNNESKVLFKINLLKVRKAFIFIFIIIFFYLKDYIYRIELEVKSKIPKVSVFLPIYNKERYLLRSISSIQNQTLEGIEIVAVNDCSTDNSLKSLKKFRKKDKRIKIVNNDRNHGLLYSRAMGILNCTGEYILNLDPDDRLEGKDNLEILYKKSKELKLDFLRYLIKLIPLNDLEIKQYNYFNAFQFKMADYYITNKFISKKTIFEAYNNFKKKIFSSKWNYHEDNIWNTYIRRNANITSNINKFIYIYKMNNQSLMLNKNKLEIKNRLYLIQAFQEINVECFELYINTIIFSNNDILKDIEIKNNFIRIAINMLNYYINSNLDNFNKINYISNKISYNKIIIFNKSLNNSFDTYLTQNAIFNFIKEKYNKRIISVNVNNDEQIKNIIHYIFPNDILIGFDDVFFNSKFKFIINQFLKNKIIIFYNYINRSENFSNINLMNYSNIFIYTFNCNLYEKLRKIIKKENIFFTPQYMINLANFFNYKNTLIKQNLLMIFNKNITYLNQIKNITSKYYQNINSINLIDNLKLLDLIEIIKNNQMIITDNIYIAKLSSIFFISCILFKNNISSNINNFYLINKLDYIKSLFNLVELEENIIKLKSKIFNENIFFSENKLF